MLNKPPVEVAFASRISVEQVEESDQLAPKFDDNGCIPCVTVHAKTKEQETKEKLSGELIDFSSETKMAGIPMLKKGRVEGKELIVYEKQFITSKETRYPFDAEGAMSWGLRKKVLENGFQEAGKTYQLKVYSPDLGMKRPVNANKYSF